MRAGLRRRNAGYGGLAVPKLDIFNGARQYVVDEGTAEKSPSPRTHTELHQLQAEAATTRSLSAGGRSTDDDRRACVGSHCARGGAVLSLTQDRGGTGWGSKNEGNKGGKKTTSARRAQVSRRRNLLGRLQR